MKLLVDSSVFIAARIVVVQHEDFLLAGRVLFHLSQQWGQFNFLENVFNKSGLLIGKRWEAEKLGFRNRGLVSSVYMIQAARVIPDPTLCASSATP